MAISRAKKEELVQGYVEQLQNSEAVIFTDYRGLGVSEMQELRAKIRQAEGGFAVVKNTLLKRAMEDAGLPIVDDLLIGPVGLGFCQQNVTGVAKAITEFTKDNETLMIKGGLMGNQVMDEAAIKDLASLPSLEVLQAQLLGLLNAPANKLANVVASGVRQVVNVTNAYAQTEAESSAPAEA